MKPVFFPALRAALCALALAVLPAIANAWYFNDSYDASSRTLSMFQDNMLQNTFRNHNMVTRNIINSNRRTQPSVRRQPTASRAALNTGKDFATVDGIAQLVSLYPQQDQRQRAEEYTKILLLFNDTIPHTYGIPKNNLATAYAIVLAGSYAAYTNRPFPDNAVKPLYRQMEQMMLNIPQLNQTRMNDKATMYQIWVSLGMVMMLGQAELAKQPNPAQQAQLQKAGGDALRTLLGVEPHRVRFTANGMEFL